MNSSPLTRRKVAVESRRSHRERSARDRDVVPSSPRCELDLLAFYLHVVPGVNSAERKPQEAALSVKPRRLESPFMIGLVGLVHDGGRRDACLMKSSSESPVLPCVKHFQRQ